MWKNQSFSSRFLGFWNCDLKTDRDTPWYPNAHYELGNNVKDFCNIHRKTPVLDSLFNKLYLKETPTKIFSCEYLEIFKNSIFCRTTPMAPFDHSVATFSIRSAEPTGHWKILWISVKNQWKTYKRVVTSVTYISMSYWRF